MTIIQKPAHPSKWTKQNTKKIGFVLHWMVGTLDATTRMFQERVGRQASAHFGIGDDGEIHQYVPTEFVAWHAGVWDANQKYIGIEHEGGQLLQDGTRRKPSHECHLASIELITKLCKDMGIDKLERGVNIFKHSEIKPTQCCGSLDIDYITNEVNKNLEPKLTENPLLEGVPDVYKNAYNNGDVAWLLGSLKDRDSEIQHYKKLLNL